MSDPTISATKSLLTLSKVSTSRVRRVRLAGSSRRNSLTTLIAAARVPLVPI